MPDKNTLEYAIRRQLSAEIGDGEPTKEQKFILLQKYGIAAPRIDRDVTKPEWMTEVVWQSKKKQWHQATKGLVQPNYQQRRTRPTSPSQPSRFRDNRNSAKPNSRHSRPNYAQTKTVVRPN